MSTRCNVHITDLRNNRELWIYKHHDGYPSGVGKDLDKFLSYGDNASLSADEMLSGLRFMYGECYEETEYEHGDIDYLYNITIGDKSTKIDVTDVNCTYDGNWNGGFHKDYKIIGTSEYMHDISGNEKMYKVSDLKEMSVSVTYNAESGIMESGILKDVPDNLYIDAKSLTDKIVKCFAGDFHKKCVIKIKNKTCQISLK